MSFFAYQNVSDTSMPVDEVEAWLNEFPQKRVENKPNGGIIQAAPSVIFVDGLGGKLSHSEKREARKKAKREYDKSLKEMAKQRRNHANALATKIRQWQNEGKAKTITTPKSASMNERRNKIIETLNSGARVEALSNKMDDVNVYHTQRRDMVAIDSQVTGGIVKLRGINSIKSFYIADNLKVYEGDKFSGKLGGDDLVEFVIALRGGEVIETESIDGRIKQASKTIRKLAANNDMGIHTVFDIGNKVRGWVML